MPIKAETLPQKADTETPTEALIKERNPVRTVVDERGRKIRYKTMSVLERARLSRALGEFASNPVYAADVGVAAAVIDIDGELGPPKTSVLQLEYRLEWLGDEGYEAVVEDNRERVAAERAAEEAGQNG